MGEEAIQVQPNQLVWFITGASKGLGLSFARAILQRGDLVIATARSPNGAKDLIALQTEYSAACKVLQLDVATDFTKIRQCAEDAELIWGRVDVVVNNGGYGIVAMTEEAGAEQFHELFKTNVYGQINVTNAFLPYMRARKGGTIIFIGSRSGWRTALPMTAIADALSVELKPFNIRVLNVVPGGLRTSNIESIRVFRGSRESGFTETGTQMSETMSINSNVGKDSGIPGYNDLFDMTLGYLAKTNGTQSGDPDRAANVVIDVVRGEGVMLMEEGEVRKWPGTLFLGSDSIRDVKARCEEVLKLLDDWDDVAKSIDYES